jgi:hypothetical protein
MDYEDRIQKIRLEEAAKKDFIGPTSKFIVIAKALGSEIVQDNFPDEGLSFWDDEVYDQNKIHEFSDDHTSTIIGYQYDGLRLGLPVEIMYKENYSNIKVFWKNRIVYEETDGILERYVSLNEWENEIDKLFTKAQAKLKALKEKQEQLSQYHKKQVDAEIIRIREKWGII